MKKDNQKNEISDISTEEKLKETEVPAEPDLEKKEHIKRLGEDQFINYR